MVYTPRKELLWQFRENISIRVFIEPAEVPMFYLWLSEQTANHYSKHVWNQKEHLLEMAGTSKGRRVFDIYCPDKAFKSVVKLAWGGK